MTELAKKVKLAEADAMMKEGDKLYESGRVG
jgi:hypothetical protein